MPVENTIHPRQLNFEPPLQQYGKDGAKGFRHYWEMLDYVFGLPDPNAFPQIPVQGGDREGILRFIEMCRRLAGFSVINDDTTLSVGTDPGTDNWHVRVVDPPTDESFLGASAAFRQLHNDGETASFINAHKRAVQGDEDAARGAAGRDQGDSAAVASGERQAHEPHHPDAHRVEGGQRHARRSHSIS